MKNSRSFTAAGEIVINKILYEKLVYRTLAVVDAEDSNLLFYLVLLNLVASNRHCIRLAAHGRRENQLII